MDKAEFLTKLKELAAKKRVLELQELSLRREYMETRNNELGDVYEAVENGETVGFFAIGEFHIDGGGDLYPVYYALRDSKRDYIGTAKLLKTNEKVHTPNL